MDQQEKKQRLAHKIQVNLAMTVREIFDEIEDDKTRPQNMAYFDRIFQTFTQGGEGAVPREKGRKLIGTYCLFVPEEIIYAAGGQPVRLCSGAYDTVEIGEDFLPDGACPMIKSEVGLSTLPVLSFYQDCDLVVIPASCDWKTKMASIIEEHAPVMMMDMPRIKEEEASRAMWHSQILRFKNEVEKVTGTRVTRRRLRAAIQTIQKAQVQFDRFHEIRKSDQPVIHGRDALEVLNAYFYDHVESWTAAMSRLNDELEERVRNQESVAKPMATRLLITGSPMVFPNWKIPTIIEEMGGVMVADEFCTSNRYLHDKVAVDEGMMSDMIHAIADRYLLPCACPIFSTSIDRKDRLLQLIDDHRVEGVIYHILKGCHPYDVETKNTEKLLEDKGVPMLKIETDYSPQDVEQLRTRIEAFMETLMGRRRA